MKPGVYDHLSNVEYHGGPGVSNSMLKTISQKSPLHMKALREVSAAANDNEPQPQSTALFIGTAFHCLVLEPEVFTREYCLGLRQQDVPDAIDDKEVLVAMVAAMNADRLPKLPTGGTKAEQVERLMAVIKTDDFRDVAVRQDLESMKGAELKAQIEALNENRHGLLSTSGTRHELAEILRANGRQVTLWSDVKEEWLRNNGHRNVLEPEQWDQLHRMRDAVMAHPAARAVLTGAQYVTELSAYASDPATGELRRVRPDLWRFDGIVADLKTTDDASLEGFARSIVKYGYDMQHPFYLDTLNLALQQAALDTGAGGQEFDGRTRNHPTSAKQFVFVAVEKTAPYAVAVYVLDTESVDVGRTKYETALRTYHECRKADAWPGYGDKVQTISLPQWHLRKFADAA